MSTLLVIPARYAAQRLPGKPLLKETGKYLVQHVWEVARSAAKIDRIVVATEDERVLQACREFGAEAVMTAAHHPSGTSRCAEVARSIDCDRIINLQGDEPDMAAEVLDRVVEALDDASYATAATSLATGDLENPNRVKVVLNAVNDSLYFTRAPVPHAMLHLGIYGFRKKFLQTFASLPECELEKKERLEQLRALWNGYTCRVAKVDCAGAGGIDTIADYRAFCARLRKRNQPR